MRWVNKHEAPFMRTCDSLFMDGCNGFGIRLSTYSTLHRRRCYVGKKGVEVITNRDAPNSFNEMIREKWAK